MTTVEKLLSRRRNNPGGWAIDDIRTLAARYGIDWRQPGTSHVTRFLALVGSIGEKHGD